MKFISLGLINKNIITIIIGCIFSFLNRLIFILDLTILFKHPIIINIYVAFSRIFVLVPLIILKVRTKKGFINNEFTKSVSSSINLIYKDPDKEVTKGKWKFIFLSSTIFFIQGIILIYTIEIKSNIWIWNIIITCLFYYLIFKIKLYKHHYISLILIILIGIILDLSLGNLQNDISTKGFLLLLRLLRESLFSFHDVINKYIMEKKFSSVYELCLYNGIICSIFLGIFSIFNYYFLKIDDFEGYFSKFNYKELLIIILVMIVQLVFYLCNLFTNKNYTPCHIFILYAFGQFAYINISLLSIIIIICHIFILFISLIFNEIIEINCWRLSENTKKNIMRRASSENLFNEDDRTIDENEEMIFKSEKEDNMETLN